MVPQGGADARGGGVVDNSQRGVRAEVILLGICPTRKVFFLCAASKINTLDLRLAHGFASRKSWKMQVEIARLSASVTCVRHCSQVLQKGVEMGWQPSVNRLYSQVRAVKEYSLR